ETKPLKDFFKKYSEPREAIDYEMQQDWCRVVADLNNDKILYLKQKTNELDSSLLNILYVVSDITGNKKKVAKQIKHIESMCSKEDLDSELNIEESLNTIFRALSNNKNLEVESKKFTVGKNRGGKPDLFGGFGLLYIFEEIENRISIDITPLHTKLDLTKNSLSSIDKAVIKRKLTEIQNIYSNSENYIESIIKQYIDLKVIKIDTAFIYTADEISNSVLDIISAGGYSNGLKLFLYGAIQSTSYKEYIVTHFLLFDAIKPQSDNSF
ncbi:hypothetical protein NEIRO03_2757, partial [Nematocida sp. AWRm78]